MLQANPGRLNASKRLGCNVFNSWTRAPESNPHDQLVDPPYRHQGEIVRPRSPGAEGLEALQAGGDDLRGLQPPIMRQQILLASPSSTSKTVWAANI